MREVLNDKKDLKNVILERVNEQIAAEVPTKVMYISTNRLLFWFALV